MCRNNNHGGRRCPADTSEARRLRLHKAKLLNSYSPMLEEKTVPVEIPVELKENALQPVTEEQTKKDIEKLQALLQNKQQWSSPAGNPETRDWLLAIDQQMTQVGLNIEYLAETKYGAPTDSEIKTLFDETETEKLAIANEYDPQIEKYKTIVQENLVKGVALANEWDDELNAALQQHALSRETHPIIRERWEELARLAPETWAELEKKKEAAEKYRKIGEEARDKQLELMNKKRELFNAHALHYDSEVSEALRKRNTGMLKALENVGVVFAKDGDLKVSGERATKAIQTINAVTSYYPSKWVEASNERQSSHLPLKVKLTEDRAHYNDRVLTSNSVKKTLSTFVVKPDNYILDPYDQSDSEIVPVSKEGTWQDPASKIVYEIDDEFRGRNTYRSIAYDYKLASAVGKKPAGWKEVQLWKKVHNPETGRRENSHVLETYYRKPKTKSQLTSKTGVSELTISPQPASITNNKASNTTVAVHELAHRMEKTVPETVQLQRAFLLRRAGVLGANPEQLTTIYNHTNEKGYRDNFPTHYMGKVYDGNSYEILSMGMEALFEGTRGAFVGIEGMKADADYKRTILAILATGK